MVLKMSFQEVLSTINSWPTTEQIRLFDVWRQALPPDALHEDLLAEIERRSDEYDQGKVTAIPWAEARMLARREAGLDE